MQTYDSGNEDCDDIIFETVVMVEIVMIVVVIINFSQIGAVMTIIMKRWW